MVAKILSEIHGNLLNSINDIRATHERIEKIDKEVMACYTQLFRLNLAMTPGELEVGGVKFKIEDRSTLNTAIGFSDDQVLKVENFKTKEKMCDIAREFEILHQLSLKNLVSIPRVLSRGKLPDGRPYYISERIKYVEGVDPSDILFAYLEILAAGILYLDVRPQNVLFDGTVTRFCDFDQCKVSIDLPFNFTRLRLTDLHDLPNLPYNGTINFDEVAPKMSEYLTADGRLDLSNTTLLKKAKTTYGFEGIYSKVEGRSVFVNGERDLTGRMPVLEQILTSTGETILDVGCNLGLMVRYFTERRGIGRADGLELSRETALACSMINHCERIYETSSIYSADIGDPAYKLPRDYDTVLLFSVLHHVKNTDHAIGAILERCKRRIVIEARLTENGEVYDSAAQKWLPTGGWSFPKVEDMIEFFESKFRGFKLSRNFGRGERERYTMEFTKS